MKLVLRALCLSISLGVMPTLASATPQSLPSAVRAYLPRGTTSFIAQRMPIGPNGTKMFVHLWGAVRPNRPDSLNTYNAYSDSPFCVDIFEPRLDEKKRWGWHLVASAAYIDNTIPGDIEFHWLQPAKKQGPILEIISGNGAPGISIYHTIFTWPNGFQLGFNAPPPQMFGSGGAGGGSLVRSFDSVDERGYTTLTTTDSYNGRLISTTVSRWDGEHFAAPDAAK